MIIGSTPFLRIALVNPFLDTRYPREGSVLAVVDTGYEGFVAVPLEVFSELGFSEMQPHQSHLVLPTGTVVDTTYAYGIVVIEELGVEEEGPIETLDGLSEVIIGQELLKKYRLEVDYCRGTLSLEPCL